MSPTPSTAKESARRNRASSVLRWNGGFPKFLGITQREREKEERERETERTVLPTLAIYRKMCDFWGSLAIFFSKFYLVKIARLRLFLAPYVVICDFLEKSLRYFVQSTWQHWVLLYCVHLLRTYVFVRVYVWRVHEGKNVLFLRARSGESARAEDAIRAGRI